MNARHFFCSAINCTTAPTATSQNDLGRMNWTEVPGIPRPYATEIVYSCPLKDWGFPSTGFNTAVTRCGLDGSWNFTEPETCVSKFVNTFV